MPLGIGGLLHTTGLSVAGVQKAFRSTIARVPTELGDPHACDPVRRRRSLSIALLASAAHRRSGIHLHTNYIDEFGFPYALQSQAPAGPTNAH